MKKMSEIAWMITVWLAASAVMAGCAGEGGPSSTGDPPASYEEDCELACEPQSPPSIDCTDMGIGCQSLCATATKGQTQTCASCLMDHIELQWQTCSCDAGSCERCTFAESFANGQSSDCYPVGACDSWQDNTCTQVMVPGTFGPPCEEACAESE